MSRINYCIVHVTHVILIIKKPYWKLEAHVHIAMRWAISFNQDDGLYFYWMKKDLKTKKVELLYKTVFIELITSVHMNEY